MNTQELIRGFEANTKLYVRLKEEALFILEPAIQEADIKCHSIPSRIKTCKSFLEKVQRREPTNHIEEITDIVGIRIICLFLSDIDRIAQLIRETFLVVSEDSRVEGADVSSFGYMSVHFVVKMKPECTGPRYHGITNIPFEVQVRTIAMDAWASVSHHLDYKSDKAVPEDLKRDFYALSGLFYVADKHFEMFYRSSRISREQMSEFFEGASVQEKAQQEINLDSLKAYLHKKLSARRHADADSLSYLVDELLTIGYRTIGEIDQMLDRTVNAFARCEARNSPFIADGQFSDVGVVRVSASLNDEKYHRMIYAGDKDYREITGEDLENPEYVSLKNQYDECRKILNEQS